MAAMAGAGGWCDLLACVCRRPPARPPHIQHICNDGEQYTSNCLCLSAVCVYTVVLSLGGVRRACAPRAPAGAVGAAQRCRPGRAAVEAGGRSFAAPSSRAGADGGDDDEKKKRGRRRALTEKKMKEEEKQKKRRRKEKEKKKKRRNHLEKTYKEIAKNGGRAGGRAAARTRHRSIKALISRLRLHSAGLSATRGLR